MFIKNKTNILYMSKENEFFCGKKKCFSIVKKKQLDRKIFEKLGHYRQNTDVFIANERISDISERIRNYEWEEGIDWRVTRQQYVRTLQEYRNISIKVDPKLPCSRDNPLYKHNEWITRVCNDSTLNNGKRLSNRIIAKICNVDKGTIQRSRDKFNIDRYITTRPSKYKTSHSKSTSGIRREHQEVILDFLMKNPYHNWAKDYLIQGRLKKDIEIHHINFNKLDNKIENLWIYETKSEHQKGESSLNLCFEKLIKMSQITFFQGLYSLNTNLDYRSLDYSKIKEILELESPKYYSDLKNIQKTIKTINWDDISQDWTVSFKGERSNQYSRDIVITLDPYSDCSKENPLYMHKQWYQRVINDKRFYLQEKDIAQLCGEKLNRIRDWKFRKHELKKSFIPRRTKISTTRTTDENHPFTYEKNRMKLHRFVMERYLADHPELEISKKCMRDGKYLKPECPVHHINFDKSDVHINNLWPFPNKSEHLLVHHALVRLVPELLSRGLLKFNKGNYELSPLYSITF